MKKAIFFGTTITIILCITMYFVISDSKISDKNNNLFNEGTENKGEEISKVKKQELEEDVENKSEINKDKTDKVSSIANLSDFNIGDLVKIKGEIIDMNISRNNHIFLKVNDNTGSILVPIFNDKDIDKSKITKNIEVEITGKIDMYNGELEIIPEKNEDIKVLGDISNNKDSDVIIDDSSIGSIVTVEGDVVSSYTHKDGHVFLTLKIAESQKLKVVIFNNLDYDTSNIRIGTNMTITGKVKKYKGEIEVIPNESSDININ